MTHFACADDLGDELTSKRQLAIFLVFDHARAEGRTLLGVLFQRPEVIAGQHCQFLSLNLVLKAVGHA